MTNRTPPIEDVLMPIGKYRGMPVDVVLQDPGYVEWVCAQPWFRERFGNVYNIIINRGEPDDTPAHNALQTLFLDEDYRIRFALTADEAFRKALVAEPRERLNARIQAHVNASLSRLRIAALDARRSNIWLEREYQSLCENVAWVTAFFASPHFESPPPQFEVDGVDVTFKACAGFRLHTGGDYIRCERTILKSFRIEIKPSIGEDYPAILRQMRRSGAGYLFLEAYTGVQIDEARFRLYFESQGIRVVFRREVDESTLPSLSPGVPPALDIPTLDQLTEVPLDPAERFRAGIEARNAQLGTALEDATIRVSGQLIRISISNPVLERRLSEPALARTIEDAATAAFGEKCRIDISTGQLGLDE